MDDIFDAKRRPVPNYINGKKLGSRRQVWNGTAAVTTGGLTKKDLMQKKDGSIVSRKASRAAAKNPAMSKWVRAAKAEGYLKKGAFAALPKKGTAGYNRIKARMARM